MSATRYLIVRFEIDEDTTDEEAEAAAELMVTQAPIEMDVVTFEGIEVTR